MGQLEKTFQKLAKMRGNVKTTIKFKVNKFGIDNVSNFKDVRLCLEV
jgi:hypothetical protein